MTGREIGRRELLRRYGLEKAEFVVVYGRRRVGKTYLIDETFDGKITFRHAGLSPSDDSRTGELNRQLENFNHTLSRHGVIT